MNKIEGGPECKGCREGKITTGGYDDPLGIYEDTCPTCHGTGRKPLSEWTDAQKAEWLQEKLTHWGIKACTDTVTGAGYWWVWRRTLPPGGGIPYEYFVSRVEFSEGGIAEAWSQALTAAVEAVAKERDA